MDGLVLLSMGQSVAQFFVELLRGLPPWLIVLFIAMLPIVELRGAIPVAIAVLDMHWGEAVLYSIIGNMIPIPFILYLLGPISRWLSRWKLFDRFFKWLFARTLKRSKALENTEAVGLIMFVAIPLPVTGAWTGSLAAYLLGFPLRKSLIYVLIGVLIASAVVTLATLGVIGAAGLVTG